MDLVLATNDGHFVAGVLDRFNVHVMSLWSFGGIRRRSALWIARGRLFGITFRTFLLWRLFVCFLWCLLRWRGGNWRRGGRWGVVFSFRWRRRFLLGTLHLLR